MLRLTKQHFRSNRNVPILTSDDGVLGPLSVNDILPHSNTTAGVFVQRHLLGEQLPSDPELKVDQSADKEEYCLQYLCERVSNETLQWAIFFAKLKAVGIPFEKYIQA